MIAWHAGRLRPSVCCASGQVDYRATVQADATVDATPVSLSP